MSDDIHRTKYATKFRGPNGRVLWRSGRVLGEEITIPEGERPYPDRDVVYEKVEEIKTGKRKQRGDEAVADAIEESEED